MAARKALVVQMKHLTLVVPLAALIVLLVAGHPGDPCIPTLVREDRVLLHRGIVLVHHLAIIWRLGELRVKF